MPKQSLSKGGDSLTGSLPAAYTQTFTLVSRVHPAATQVTVDATAATNVTPWGYSQAQADAIVTQVNNARADIYYLKQLVNSVIDDLQARGVIQ